MPARGQLVPCEVPEGARDVHTNLPHVTRDLLDVFTLGVFNLTEQQLEARKDPQRT